MQVITVDLGNTNPHVGIYQNDKLEKIVPLEKISELNIDPKTPLMTASVRKEQEKLLTGFSVIELPRISGMKFLDMPVNYSSSLGEDRLVQCYFLYKSMEVEELCLIDIGTFITVDFVSKSEGYQGGFIFPGINTFVASYKNGARLPLLDRSQIDWQREVTLPHNTYEAISEATKLYIQGVCGLFKENNIVLTGGDTAIVQDYFEQEQLMVQEQLIHDSLYYTFKQLYP